MSNRAVNVSGRDATVIDAFVMLQREHHDAEQQRQLEVSIEYSIALMDYWLSSAQTSRAQDDVAGS